MPGSEGLSADETSSSRIRRATETYSRARRIAGAINPEVIEWLKGGGAAGAPPGAVRALRIPDAVETAAAILESGETLIRNLSDSRRRMLASREEGYTAEQRRDAETAFRAEIMAAASDAGLILRHAVDLPSEETFLTGLRQAEAAFDDARRSRRIHEVLIAISDPGEFSYRFMSRLLELGLPPDRVGDALVFVPEKEGGMTVHDLMSYRGGREFLAESAEALVARIKARDPVPNAREESMEPG